MNSRATASPNIALIKYWGKKPSTSDFDRNLALNPSISFTLSKAQTSVEIRSAADFTARINDQIANEKDLKKLQAHTARVAEFLKSRGVPCAALENSKIHIDSKNNFPMGAGLASSASAFAALTKALLSFAAESSPKHAGVPVESKFVSALARRGSGSAARSVVGPWAIWDGEYARPLSSQWKLYDTIVILSDQQKLVSSSDGHEAAQRSPLMIERQRRLPARIDAVLNAIEERSMQKLGKIIEEEALEMHEVARSSHPSIEYLLPDSFRLIKALQESPKRNHFFTIDAGPNLHVISEEPVETLLRKQLGDLGIAAELWCDSTSPENLP